MATSKMQRRKPGEHPVSYGTDKLSLNLVLLGVNRISIVHCSFVLCMLVKTCSDVSKSFQYLPCYDSRKTSSHVRPFCIPYSRVEEGVELRVVQASRLVL